MMRVVLEVVCCGGHLSLADLGHVACLACDDDAVPEGAWRAEARRRWGAGIERGHHRLWRQACRHLASVSEPQVLGGPRGADVAFRDLWSRGMLARTRKAVAEALVAALALAPRQITLYIASDAFRRRDPALADGAVLDVVRGFRSLAAAASDPEAALRAFLVRLPFLPIACGLGTDGLIRAIARVYGEAHPRASCDDHTYILLYSLIILNTDLHNDRVRRKITEDAYVESLARTQISGAILESDARRHYRSIKADPLRCGADDAAAPTRTGRARLFGLQVPPSAAPTLAAAALVAAAAAAWASRASAE